MGYIWRISLCARTPLPRFVHFPITSALIGFGTARCVIRKSFLSKCVYAIWLWGPDFRFFRQLEHFRPETLMVCVVNRIKPQANLSSSPADNTRSLALDDTERRVDDDATRALRHPRIRFFINYFSFVRLRCGGHDSRLCNMPGWVALWIGAKRVTRRTKMHPDD